MEAALAFFGFQDDVEAAGHGDDELVEIFVGVAAAFGASGDVVKVVDALDFERDVTGAFDEREIAARIVDAREVDDAAFGEVHELGSFLLAYYDEAGERFASS